MFMRKRWFWDESHVSVERKSFRLNEKKNPFERWVWLVLWFEPAEWSQCRNHARELKLIDNRRLWSPLKVIKRVILRTMSASTFLGHNESWHNFWRSATSFVTSLSGDFPAYLAGAVTSKSGKIHPFGKLGNRILSCSNRCGRLCVVSTWMLNPSMRNIFLHTNG